MAGRASDTFVRKNRLKIREPGHSSSDIREVSSSGVFMAFPPLSELQSTIRRLRPWCEVDNSLESPAQTEDPYEISMSLSAFSSFFILVRRSRASVLKGSMLRCRKAVSHQQYIVKLALAIFDPFGEKSLNAKTEAFKDCSGVLLISRHLRD